MNRRWGGAVVRPQGFGGADPVFSERAADGAGTCGGLGRLRTCGGV